MQTKRNISILSIWQAILFSHSFFFFYYFNYYIFPTKEWTNLSITVVKRTLHISMNIWTIKITLLTLFAWMGLLSSTGSTAAALTLNRTPMRAANTSRSCILWQECRWRTRATVTGAGGSQSVEVSVCLRERDRESEPLRLARDPEESAGESAVQLVAAGHKIWKPLMFLLLYLWSPSLFYTPLPLSATDVESGGCMTEGGGCMCADVWAGGGGCIRKCGKGGEMRGTGQNKWNRSTVNLFDKLWGGCVHVIHQREHLQQTMTSRG